MLILVDPHSGVPVYRQLMDQIKVQVTTGNLAEGAELPSTRALAAKLGVNPMTVSKAYRLLEVEGLIQRRPGLPSVVRPVSPSQRKQSEIDELSKALQPAVRLVRQLGLAPNQALMVLKDMLNESAPIEEEPREKQEKGEGR